MPSYGGVTGVREDFRCSRCQQKNAFHCEHDTPYRDQIMNSLESDKTRFASANSQRNHQRAGGSNYGAANGNGQPPTERQIKISSEEHAHTQKGKKRKKEPNQNTTTDANNNPAAHTDKSKKRSGCTIL